MNFRQILLTTGLWIFLGSASVHAHGPGDHEFEGAQKAHHAPLKLHRNAPVQARPHAGARRIGPAGPKAVGPRRTRSVVIAPPASTRNKSLPASPQIPKRAPWLEADGLPGQ